MIYRFKMKGSYRESFGLALPPEGTEVRIEYLSGCDFYIVWSACPDGENILYGWIKKKIDATKIVNQHNWVIKNR